MRRFPEYKKPIRLHLGCGDQHMDGFINIDLRDCGQDMVWDLTKGIPFPDNSVEEVYSCHFIEHLTDDESIDLFREIYRVLKPKGRTHHRCPHQTHPTAYYWGHKSFWNEARLEAITRVPELENFLIVQNDKQGSELIFILSKMK